MRLAKSSESALVKKNILGNILILVSGTTVAQAVPILISPILTRLYTPEEFGVLAIFLALTTTFSTISSGRYEAAIILPEKEEEAMNVAAVGVVCTVGVSLLLLIATLLFHHEIAQILHNEGIANWLYLCPIAVLLLGSNSVLNQLNVRSKQYRTLAQTNVTRAISQAGIQLLLGVARLGTAGLLIGNVLSHLTGNRVLSRNVLTKERLAFVNQAEMTRLAKKYSGFPKYSMWAILANSLAQNLISIIMSALYTIVSLGFYSLVNRILGLPTAIVGESIAQVFIREARDEKERSGQITRIVKSALIRLTLISLPVFLILYFTIEMIVAFIFGENWRIAGEYARILIPMFFIRFITVPVMPVLNLFERQKLSLLWQLGLLLIVITVSVISKELRLQVEQYLSILTVCLSVHYLIMLGLVWKVSHGGRERML